MRKSKKEVLTSTKENEQTAVGTSWALTFSTLAISALVILSSIMGIFVRSTYARDTANWATQARGQDVANLFAMGLYLPAMIVAGISLCKNRTFGYDFGLPLLIFGVLMGLGVLLIILA